MEIRSSDKLMQQYPVGKVLSIKDDELRDDCSFTENSFSPTSKITSPLRSSKMTEMTQMSGKGIIENYVVEILLEKKSFRTVYLCHHSETEIKYVIKQVHMGKLKKKFGNLT